MKKKFSILVLFILFCSLFCGCSDDSENSSDKHETSMYSVYFCSNDIANWNKVYVYAWDDKGKNAEWPGLMMKKAGDGLYSSDVKFSNIIFNDLITHERSAVMESFHLLISVNTRDII